MGECRCVCRVLVEKPEGRRPLEKPRRGWRIILKWILETWDRGTDWIDLAEVRGRWRTSAKAVMNLRLS
jgi:hypothetical protein